MMTVPTFTVRSARTTPMPAPATRTAGFIARRLDGRPSFAIWATPPWRTGMGWRWPAGSRMPMAPPNAGASETMLKARRKAAGRHITAGEDKAYDTADHVANLRAIGVTPHVTQNQAVTKTGKNRKSAIDQRTTRHQGYGMSQSRRAMVECIFGWGKQHGTMRKTKHRGIARVAADFLLNLIAYNLIRIPKLVAA